MNQTGNDAPTLDEIKKAQIDCEMCQKIRGDLRSEGNKRNRRIVRQFLVENDVLYRIREETRLIVVPMELRERLIRNHHDDPLHGHVGRAAVVDQLETLYYWPYLQKDVEDYILWMLRTK